MGPEMMMMGGGGEAVAAPAAAGGGGGGWEQLLQMLQGGGGGDDSGKAQAEAMIQAAKIAARSKQGGMSPHPDLMSGGSPWLNMGGR